MLTRPRTKSKYWKVVAVRLRNSRIWRLAGKRALGFAQLESWESMSQLSSAWASASSNSIGGDFDIGYWSWEFPITGWLALVRCARTTDHFEWSANGAPNSQSMRLKGRHDPGIGEISAFARHPSIPLVPTSQPHSVELLLYFVSIFEIYVLVENQIPLEYFHWFWSFLD